jgi:Tfp pilus assembly pilus retraction ATPase PilT
MGYASFASALRAALREEPMTILVGEMRDPKPLTLP